MSNKTKMLVKYELEFRTSRGSVSSDAPATID